MLGKKLPLRIPIDPNIRIQPQRLPAPDLFHRPLPLPIPIHHQVLQRCPAPQRLRKPLILDLEPIVDANGIALFRLPRGSG